MSGDYLPSQYPHKKGGSRHLGWDRETVVRNKERTERLVKQYTEAGMGTNEIARRLGYANNSISRIKKFLGLTKKTKPTRKAGASSLAEVRALMPRVSHIAYRRRW